GIFIVTPRAPRGSTNLAKALLRLQDFAQQHVHFALGLAGRVKVDAAFFNGVLLPPPASRAIVFAGSHRARARVATDAGVAFAVKWMARNIVLFDIFVHLPLGPVGQRAELRAAIDNRKTRDFATRSRLPPAQTNRPRAQRFQLAVERPDLADVAAQHSKRRVIAKKIRPVAQNHAFYLVGVGHRHFELQAVAIADPVDHFVCRLGQPARVHRNHPDFARNASRQIYHHHPLGLEAGHNSERVTVALDGPAEKVGRFNLPNLHRKHPVWNKKAGLSKAQPSTDQLL